MKEVICILCPLGCKIKVITRANKPVRFYNHQCKKGKLYAKQEAITPYRNLTTTIKIKNGILSVVPVKLDGPIPKHRIIECMEYINRLSVIAPVECGTIVARNILGLNVNLVTTRRMKKRG